MKRTIFQVDSFSEVGKNDSQTEVGHFSSRPKRFDIVWHGFHISLTSPNTVLPPQEKARDNFNSLFETNNSRDRRLVVTTASHYNTRAGMAH